MSKELDIENITLWLRKNHYEEWVGYYDVHAIMERYAEDYHEAMLSKSKDIQKHPTKS